MNQTAVSLTARQIATVFCAGVELMQRHPTDLDKRRTAMLYAVFDAPNVAQHIAREQYVTLDEIRKELFL